MHRRWKSPQTMRSAVLLALPFALAACSDAGGGALRRGNQAAARGEFAAAEAEFQKAVAEAPRSARALELLGNAQWTLGKKPEAQERWRAALALDAAAADAHLGLARVELDRGAFEPALKHLEAVKEPRADEKALRAVVLLARGGEGDARLAQQAAGKALQLDPESKDALYTAGCAALALRDDAGAQRLFDRLLQTHQKSELGPLGLARLAAAKGQRTDVLLYLRATRKAMGDRWKSAEVLKDPAFAWLGRDAELAREVGDN
jgi:cellulose synthase operon protein C